jgi:hypothetical protein
MEATMTLESTHRPIGFAGAFTRQFNLLWTSRRPILMFLGLVGLLAIVGEPWNDDRLARLFTVWPVWMAFVGPIWAFVVWHNEGPSSRLYHWAQPVSRPTHDLARLTAGAVWLWLLYAALIVAGLLLALVDGEVWQFGEINFAGWVNLFSGPLLGFLIISVLTLPSDYPIRWFFGLFFLTGLLISLLDEWLDWDQVVERIIQPIAHDQWGLGVTLVGAFGESVIRLDHVVRTMSDPDHVLRGNFDTTYWWFATALWLAAFLALVVWVAHRHPDRLPRLRRGG